MIRIFIILVLFFITSYSGIAQKRPFSEPIFRLFLIGDTGLGENPSLDLLGERLESSGKNSGVIFLGDNIYNHGMPPEGDRRREEAEKIIDAQIEIVKDFKGKVFFIPGNHDWDNGKEHGWDYLVEQERYIEEALDSANVFLPTNGCPGPIEVPLTDNITLIILDTQYFLHRGSKPGRSSSCGSKTAEEAFVNLMDILQRNINKKVILASHHPIYTKGMHGGVVTAKDHLFPLTKLNSSLYIPLPIIGSLFPLYRQTIGSIQDQANLQHKAMVKTINKLIIKHRNLVHVAGHEHALQYLSKDNVNYIVSGSGSKQNTTVKLRKPSLFAGNYHGYGIVDYYANGEVWLTFESPDVEEIKVYEAQISRNPFSEDFLEEDYGQFSILPRGPYTARASEEFESGKSRRVFFGEGYRAEWYQPVKVPVFDIGKEKGGLKIIKRGGGNQTTSIRLEADDDKQYVLRLLEKDATKLIPEEFQSSFVKKAVQEGISGSNPYAAFVVPPMADAAGVYHTNPKLVYLPDDPRFGLYREDLKDKLALFEERPAKDQSDAEYFGESEKVINTADMLESLYDDNDNSVDQQAVLRARLFDTFLSDWDRHDDQWRWSRFDKDGKGHAYQPIPRDRDQVFYVSEGIIPSILGLSWAIPPLQGFGPKVKNVTGLWSFAAKYFDRSFLTELDRQDWTNAAREMQENLTDEVIEEAISSWPDEIYQYHGEEIIRNLKLRRDQLDEVANQYYNALAKKVDVVGSNKQEQFLVRHIDNDTTEVIVNKLNKEGEVRKVLYHRKFITGETKEICLYGLGGEDKFEVTGEAKHGPLIRAIGGNGEDVFVDNSKLGRIKKTWLVYDLKKDTEIEKGKETKNKTSSNPAVNIYDRNAFNYNHLGPLISIKFNKDDGLFLGAGLSYKNHGFRKKPFKSKHKFGLTNSVATASYAFGYEGEFTDLLGKADLQLRGELRSPNYVTNFFGIGNETDYNKASGIDYYRVRYEEFLLDVHLRFDLNEITRLRVGSSSQMIRVEPTQGRFITTIPENGLDSTIFNRKSWTGISGSLDIDNRDREILTERGLRWITNLGLYKGLSSDAGSYGSIQTDFTFYYSFKQPSRVTLSNRTGYGNVFGSPEFYQLLRLDGGDQMRGFRKYRFAGETVFYNNTDINVRLVNVRAYILPTQIGIKFFYDIGRVGVSNEESSRWHQSYGAAFWISPARVIYISFLSGWSVEGWYPSVKFAFSTD